LSLVVPVDGEPQSAAHVLDHVQMVVPRGPAVA
jgi:hypothetical protein